MIKTNPIDKEWKEEISTSKWWAVNYKGVLSEKELKMIPLRDKLLSFGGEEACLPIDDEDFDKIMNRGFIIDADEIYVEHMPGRKGQCHANSCELYEINKERPTYKDTLKLMTGYALSADGMWVQHTWLYDIDEEHGNAVIETTVERVAYFGFIMSDEEAEEFCSWY